MDDYGPMVIGAVVTGGIALALAFIKSLFTRNVETAERTMEKMQKGIESILLELRSMHDEIGRQRGEMMLLARDVANLQTAVKAAHERIDALIAPPPRPKRKD